MKKVQFILVLAIQAITFLTVSAYASTLDDFVNKASGEVGVSYAMDPNRGYYTYDVIKYGEWFNSQRFFVEQWHNGNYYLHESPWCAIFVSWCSDQVGLGIPRYSDVNDMLRWYKNNGRYHDWWSYNPKRGDVVFFTRDGSYSHVAIIEYVENTSDSPFANGKRIKMTLIEGDCVSGGDGWKSCSVERTNWDVRTSDPKGKRNGSPSSNVVVGFGEN